MSQWTHPAVRKLPFNRCHIRWEVPWVITGPTQDVYKSIIESLEKNAGAHRFRVIQERSHRG